MRFTPLDPPTHGTRLSPGAGDVAVITPDGELAAVGEGWAQAVGRPREAMHGLPLASVLPPDEAGRVLDAVASVLAGAEAVRVPVRLRHVAGHPVRRMLQLGRVDDDRGDALCVTATLRPIEASATARSAAVLDAWESRRTLLLAQPVVDLGSRRSIRHELLLRLLTIEGDVLVPDEIIPVLLEHGRGGALDRFIVDAAVGLLCDSAGNAPGVLEINLSAAAIADPAEITQHIRRGLVREQVTPARLVCGLDLGDVAADPDGATLLAATLQQIGCRVALDRAQATPETLALLHQVPYDILRLDGALVHASSRDPTKLLLLRALLSAVARDGTEPVAAGVQDDVDVALLRRTGVFHGQGFHLGVPGDPVELLGAH